MLTWCDKVLRSNLSYFRLRRDLFGEFVAALDIAILVNFVTLSDEEFLILGQFLTERDEGLNDSKKLSFDKAIMAIRSRAALVVEASRPGIVARVASAITGSQ